MSSNGSKRDANWVALKRSVAPYVGMGIIIGGVSIFATATALKKDPLGTLEVNAVLWALFAGWVYLGSRYRIYWREDAIRQRASGKPDVTIQMKQIGSLDLEVGVDAGRPFRRIAIYTKEPQRSQFIDVSLKHFSAPDIRALVARIRAARPELEVPSQWS